MKEEQEKLADLEFELKVAIMTKQDEDIINLAKGKYRKQLNKILRLQSLGVEDDE